MQRITLTICSIICMTTISAHAMDTPIPRLVTSEADTWTTIFERIIKFTTDNQIPYGKQSLACLWKQLTAYTTDSLTAALVSCTIDRPRLEYLTQRRYLIGILICAGAKLKNAYILDTCIDLSGRLLHQALMYGDVNATHLLLAHGAHPNATHWANPVITSALTVSCARTLIQHGADISDKQGLLYTAMNERYSPDLIRFYVNKGIDPYIFYGYDTPLTSLIFHTPNYTDETYLQKAQILLTHAPHLVNTAIILAGHIMYPIEYLADKRKQLSWLTGCTNKYDKLLAVLQKYKQELAQVSD